MKYVIKERHNPQLGVYFVAMGCISNARAKGRGKCLYGSDIMHAFDTRKEYELELQRLRESGERVQ